MKFLIAGLGSIGRRHFRNLLALGERDIILYRTHRATLPDDDLAGFPVETDLLAALAHRPDAVIVSNPTALHLDVAIPAAEAGFHLFLEKPVSHVLERLDRLRNAVARTGVKVLVGFQFRFHPGLRLVHRLLNESQPAIGRAVSARAHWGEYLPNWHPWEDFRQGYAARPDLGGGVVLTLCHPFDYVRWLLGDACLVSALTSSQGLGLPVEDTAEIGLRFASGVVGSVHLDYIQRPPRHTLEIIGTEGTIRWDNADGAVQLSAAGADGNPGDWQRFPAPADFDRNVMFLDQMRHFRAVCRGEAEPLCSLDDGIAALELALAVHRLANAV
ncbi:MAG: Gfo/Idh/MocA family protein [Chloroflexota bacterium]